MYDLSVIYRIDINGGEYYYIGSTNEFKRRKKEHLRELEQGTHHNKRMQQLYNSGSKFKFSVIEEVWDTKQLLVREQVYLDKHIHDFNCINKAAIASGGSKNPATPLLKLLPPQVSQAS